MALDKHAAQAIGIWINGLRNNRREGVPGVHTFYDISIIVQRGRQFRAWR